jgi:hypothetical protein
MADGDPTQNVPVADHSPDSHSDADPDAYSTENEPLANRAPWSHQPNSYRHSRR